MISNVKSGKSKGKLDGSVIANVTLFLFFHILAATKRQRERCKDMLSSTDYVNPTITEVIHTIILRKILMTLPSISSWRCDQPAMEINQEDLA